jgi:CcmD family protein
MNGSTVILAAILIIWAGVLAYLVALERKVSRLERKAKRNEG